MLFRRKPSPVEIPAPEAVEGELQRLSHKKEYRRTLRSTLYGLLAVAALAVLWATLFLPILQVSGTSMSPTLVDGDILCLLKTEDLAPGDLCGFYWQNKLLLKRVIGRPGDQIVVDPEGMVYVNGEKLDEPYVAEHALGECDLTFPYQVPDNHYFVLGDKRASSIDSRSSTIGCVGKDQLVGKVVLRIWPTARMALLN